MLGQQFLHRTPYVFSPAHSRCSDVGVHDPKRTRTSGSWRLYLIHLPRVKTNEVEIHRRDKAWCARSVSSSYVSGQLGMWSPTMMGADGESPGVSPKTKMGAIGLEISTNTAHRITLLLNHSITYRDNSPVEPHIDLPASVPTIHRAIPPSLSLHETPTSRL
ncbi:hypothetical protein BS47DRAFT_1403107 [Hydnum rufescens UP504]|uniref:Uncharacterized protein n=1 Tax=Hydnum rufescens UP504 TaxID=1448309 RepID=A0A9P6ACX1_9AGAM|nr:hypothetical protein BS47DRAFT_1403107 [Hydnum rufescens UP504]